MDSEMLGKTRKVLEIYSARGKEGKALNRLYRQLFNPELYKLAYSTIYANTGSVTIGTSEETLDGMSNERIDNIIQNVKLERHRWNPVRRTYIPKGDGRNRPLGIPSGDDKLLQAAMKILLEAFYEPTFSTRSHGFRPKRGCHTALLQIVQKHNAVNWFIEGDIKGCFDNIDHEILLEIMGERIEDGRFIELTKKLLKAGYMENWKYFGTYSGTPQGGIVSPLLTNIYLDVFDRWVEEELLPKYNRSLNSKGGRRPCPEYRKIAQRRHKAKKRGDKETYQRSGKQMRSMPSVITNDEGFRKLEYVRYADDFLLSFAGPKDEAMRIKDEIREFLKDRLNLEMSPEKTLITHARTQRAKFLGYEVSIGNNRDRRSINGHVLLNIPKEVVTDACRKYSKKGKPFYRAGLIMHSDYDILALYQSEYKGLVEYYRMAQNLDTLSRVSWTVKVSLLKTLANKYKSSVAKMSKKYGGHKTIDSTRYKVLTTTVKRKGKKDLTTWFGAVSLARNPTPTQITDEKQNDARYLFRSQLIDRMDANECEMCGKSERCEVHHVRKLKDVNKPGRKDKPAWIHRMAAIRRKTLIVCKGCHRAIHNGEHLTEWDNWRDTLESRVR